VAHGHHRGIIPSFARLTANLAASIAARDYMTTARLFGVPRPVMITTHMLPNVAEPLLIVTSTTFSVVIMEISGLSFVGLGVQPPDYDLGRLLSDALPAIYSRPVELLGPALMITVMALAAMLIGDGLAAAADPRSRRLAASARTPRHRARRVATSTPMTDNVVELANMRISTTAGEELVHGSTLSLARGEILAIVGESGSGKSLTAMAIAGLLPDGLVVEADRLELNGIDLLVGDPDPKAMAESVALVYQDPSSTFNQALPLRSQLTEVLRIHRGYSKRRAEEAITEALRTVRIPDPARLLAAHPYELSGGMRQRAMIASALVVDPSLIIADEPTTALDVTVQAEILREFRAMNRTRGTSMLFISHDLGVVEALCDRILVMQEGRIVEELTGAELAAGEASHPYTRKLLAATPRLDTSIAPAAQETVTR
jgi:ABC-type dipeptide/oligopeptide/nickel transport system ATPase component